MNKKLITALILLTSNAFANIDYDIEANRMAYLESVGLPLPDSGIKIIPRSVMDLPKDILEKGAIEEQQMLTQGYINKDTSRPLELLNFKSHARMQFLSQPIMGETSTGLRHSLKELHLGFKLKPIPIKVIAVVPHGSFHPEGWSGAVQFFDSGKNSCAYAVMNVAVSHTAAELAQEDVTYAINNKATLIAVEGNKHSGFHYKIDWFDNDNFHTLECANMIYSKQIQDNIIKLATQIDIS